MKHCKDAVRKITGALFLAVLFFTAAVSVPAAEIVTNSIANWPAGPEISNETAVVMDADTGVILYDKGMDEIRYPASTTKILTALVAIENSSLTDEVTFGENAVSQAIPGNAKIDMQVGEVLTMDQCLHAVLLASANEVSTQVAEYIGGSVENFCSMMNEKAASIGCTNTHFTNANGLPDENHYTTAHDLALIMQAAIQNETFCSIEKDLFYTIPPTNMNGSPRELRNHHAMLFEGDWYYEGAFAGKTGYTDEAQNTLVTAARRDDMTLICVTLRSGGLETFNDTRKLLDYGFSNFKHATPDNKDLRNPSGVVTLPSTVSLTDLTVEDTKTEETVIRTYSYQGQYVGSVSGSEKPSENASSASDNPSPADALTEQVSENVKEAAQTALHFPVLVMAGMDIAALIVLIILIVRKKKKKNKKKRK